jgi:hypothetical protein
MIEQQANRYRSFEPDNDANAGKPDRRVTSHERNLRRSSQADFVQDPVPLFLSDSDGEPDPTEFTALLQKPRASISSRIFAGVCAAAAVAVLVSAFSSDAMQTTLVDAKASMTAIFPGQSAAAKADPSELASFDKRNDPAVERTEDPARPLPGYQTPDRLTSMASVEPAREESKIFDQSAVQGVAVQGPSVQGPSVQGLSVQGLSVPSGGSAVGAAAEPATLANSIHHLEPQVIASLLRRGIALIGTGDVAAARLVLRRAADAGDASAALALAGTFDPASLAKLGVRGISPDVAQARSWYEKAKQFGSAEASQRLERLASQR